MQIIAQTKSSKYVLGYNRRNQYVYGTKGSASWVQRLNNTAWVPLSDDSGFVQPKNVENRQIRLVPELIDILIEKGVSFQ